MYKKLYIFVVLVVRKAANFTFSNPFIFCAVTPKVENLTSVLYGMRTVVRVGTGSQFVKKLKRTEENRLVTVFLGFDCSSRF